MIYTAEEFGSADIMGEMERKLERLNDGRCNRNSGLP